MWRKRKRSLMRWIKNSYSTAVINDGSVPGGQRNENLNRETDLNQ
jgi:hypothetical protein